MYQFFKGRMVILIGIFESAENLTLLNIFPGGNTKGNESFKFGRGWSGPFPRHNDSSFPIVRFVLGNELDSSKIMGRIPRQ